MGEPVPSTTAEIHMQALEQTAISTTFHHINKFIISLLWKKKVMFLNIYKITK